MLDMLLYISSFMILFSYFAYIILIIIGRSKIVGKINSFNIIKDLISNYESINIIESKGYFTIYNIKRRVIKLSTKCYYGDDLSSISISLIEAGISIVDDNHNKYLDILRNVFSNLKILYIFPILSLLINNLSFSINDAKVSIVLMFLFILIGYIVIDIKNTAYVWIVENLSKIKDISKVNSLKIFNFINIVIWLDKFIFLGEFLIICRLILILFNF